MKNLKIDLLYASNIVFINIISINGKQGSESSIEMCQRCNKK